MAKIQTTQGEFDAARVNCVKCNQPMLFVRNLDTGKDGPADTRTCVYMVLKERRGQRPIALTAKRMLEGLKSITCTIEGKEVTLGPEQIEGFFVSHFNTCASAGFFGKNGGWKNNGKPRR
jgi:hypothetical protein